MPLGKSLLILATVFSVAWPTDPAALPGVFDVSPTVSHVSPTTAAAALPECTPLVEDLRPMSPDPAELDLPDDPDTVCLPKPHDGPPVVLDLDLPAWGLHRPSIEGDAFPRTTHRPGPSLLMRTCRLRF